LYNSSVFADAPASSPTTTTLPGASLGRISAVALIDSSIAFTNAAVSGIDCFCAATLGSATYCRSCSIASSRCASINELMSVMGSPDLSTDSERING
jgi:hypothetical protein